MSQLEHSPGPWSASNSAIYDAKGLAIAIASGWQGAERKWDANSELIAAAPTMYRILRIMLEDKRRPLGLIHADAMAQAHRLIQELEGGSDAEA